MNKSNVPIFWRIDENGKVRIIQSKLTEFLALSGFHKVKISNTNFIYVLEKNNRVSEVEDTVAVDFINNYLKRIDATDVLETFSKGVSNYISKTKLKLLPNTELVNDRVFYTDIG